MRILALFFLFSFNSYSQDNTEIVITADVLFNHDSSTSYIYCATMEMMWDELRNYLGEMPQSDVTNSNFELLNKAIGKNYTHPIEDQFVVTKAGLIRDSIVDQIRLEHKQKFHDRWHPLYQPTNSAIFAYAYLERNLNFLYGLDDDFDEQNFGTNVRVDCFGVDLGDPRRSRRDILVHDYIDSNDFIIQLISQDSLDEIFLAKAANGNSLLEMYSNSMERIHTGNTEEFTGNDMLIIPYIQFDTTKRYADIENCLLTNKRVESRPFQSVSQRINFDMNKEGIKLKSLAAAVIDFGEFEFQYSPRILAFNDPFLIIMKRKHSELPYFLFWVANTDFMREYTLLTRTIEEVELPLVGKWKFSTVSAPQIKRKYEGEQTIEFFPDGTFLIYQNGSKRYGTWKFNDNQILIDYSEYPNRTKTDLNWELEEITTKSLIVIDRVRKIELVRVSDDSKD